MKVIDLLNKIANDTLANGTKIVLDNELYIYNKKGKKLEVGKNKSQYRIFTGTDLNKIVEVIPVMEEVIGEEKEIEEIEEIIRFQDLCCPYGHNEQMFMKYLILHQNKINELVKRINKLEYKQCQE